MLVSLRSIIRLVDPMLCPAPAPFIAGLSAFVLQLSRSSDERGLPHSLLDGRARFVGQIVFHDPVTQKCRLQLWEY